MAKLNFKKIPRIFRSRVFLFVLGVKILMSFLFGSDYLVKGTIPFVNYFVSSFRNPYEFFYSQGILKAFPYPPFMLYVLSLFRLAFSFLFSPDWNIIMPVHLFIYRIPLLLSDILIYYLLVQLLKPKEILVTLLYWCSPILIYINYFHGQLDVIPIALLMLFIYLVYRDKPGIASFVLGLSMAAKTHIILVLPVFFVYLWKQRINIKKIIFYIGTSILTYLFILAPYLSSKGFFNMVFMAEEQFRVFSLFLELSDIKIFIIPSLFFMVFLSISTLKNMNSQLFLMVIALIYTLFVIFISPMPGWYYWSIPFIIYFLVKEGRLGHILTYYLLNLFYLLYFLFSIHSDIFKSFQVISPAVSSLPSPYVFLQGLGLYPDYISNILITLLTSTLAIIVFWVYKHGIENNIKYNLVDRPLTIGICGDSSSGKTTLTHLIKSLVGSKNITIVKGDDIHKWERGNKQWNKYTHLNPIANNLYLNFDHANKLIHGLNISRREYDHNTGKFTKPKKLYVKRFLVFEGLHQFIVPGMREFYDIKIYMDPDELLRRHWKLKRDTSKRSYTKKKVLEMISKRQKDSNNYIKPQKKYANLLISYIPVKKIKSIEKESPDFFVRVVLKDYIDVDKLSYYISKYDENFDYKYEEKTFNLILTFNCKISKRNIREIAFGILPNLRDILNNFEPNWSAGNNGVLQIILLMYINEKIESRK